MKTQLEKRHGFGAIEVIALVAILAIVGGLGWYALKGKPQASPSPSATSQVAAASPTPTPAGQTSQKSTEPYLEIKELGVKIKLTSKILDIEYVYDATAKKASFGSKSLTALANESGSTQCYAQEGPLGWITQQSQAFPANRNKPSEKDVKQLGGLYYGYFRPDVGCPGGVASNGDALQKLSDEQLTEVGTAIQTLEVIK